MLLDIRETNFMTDSASSCISKFFEWSPLGPDDILVLAALLVALFGERVWRFRDARRRAEQLRTVIVQMLKNLKQDLERTRGNVTSDETDDQRAIVSFSPTQLAEISHYFYLLQDVIIPNLDILNLPGGSKTIDLFDHYKKNLEAAKEKKHLTRATVNKLLGRIDQAIDELS